MALSRSTLHVALKCVEQELRFVNDKIATWCVEQGTQAQPQKIKDALNRKINLENASTDLRDEIFSKTNR